MHTVGIPWVTRVFASARIDFLLPFTSRFELIHPIFGVNCTRNIPLLVEDILSFEFNVNSTVRRNEPRVPCEIGLFSESRRDFEIDGDLTDAKSTSPLRRYANQPSYLFVDQASPREWIRIKHVVAFSYQRLALNPRTFDTFAEHVQRLCHVFAKRPTAQTCALPTAAFSENDGK
jgi:hypothetical protein